MLAPGCDGPSNLETPAKPLAETAPSPTAAAPIALKATPETVFPKAASQPTATTAPPPTTTPSVPLAKTDAEAAIDTELATPTPTPALAPTATQEIPWIASAGRNPFGGQGEAWPVPALRLPDAQEAARDPDASAVPWHLAHQRVGQRITIEGKVVNTHTSRQRVVFLNFDKNWQGTFYIPLFRNAFEALPESAEHYFLNKTVRVTGTVTLYKGTPNIEVHHLRQIKVVDATKGLPHAR